MKGSQRHISIVSSGSALPSVELTSAQRDVELNLPLGTVFRSSGVERRYVAASFETAASMAANAVRQAVSRAHLAPADIDCLVAACASMDQSLPYNSALIHKELGWNSGERMTFDVGASCLSFLAALDQVAYPLMAGRFRHVVLVSSDIASCGLDWKHLESSAIFGDGAAAVVLKKAGEGSDSGILSSNFLTLSEGAQFCEILGSGTRHHPSRSSGGDYLALNKFRMNGKAVFKLVSRYLPKFVEELCACAELAPNEVDWIVPHQASLLAMKHLTARLGFLPSRVVDIFSTRGNQVSASLPTALHSALSDGRIRPGNTVLLLGTSAGVSIGGMVVRI